MKQQAKPQKLEQQQAKQQQIKQNTKQIDLKSFAKINLTLDVLGTLDNGFHEVSMIMQQILLCDDVRIRWYADPGKPCPVQKACADIGKPHPAQKSHAAAANDNVTCGMTKTTHPMIGENPESLTADIRIELSTNRKYLPTDNRNLAYKAAAAMAVRFRKDEKTGEPRLGKLRIDIKKRIPVAAGLAGGSSNAAAVLHGIRKLWNLKLSLRQLCEIGQELGSDVPFCIMGQAAANENLKQDFKNDPLACHCALATGTGTDLRPLKGLRSHLVLSKPPISVSTAEVYKGIDNEIIDRHPNNDEMMKALEKNNRRLIAKNMINVLENFTLKRYPIVMYTKDKLSNLCHSGSVLMSGSGPTVFGLCKNITESKEICKKLLDENKESFWTRTTW